MKHTLFVACALSLAFAASAGAQPSARRSTAESDAAATNLKMGDTAILGERQTPDAFFIIPRGLGTGPKVAHRRDYSSDIQEPLVKSWLERSTFIASISSPRTSGESIDWQERLGGPAPEPARAPVPAQPLASASDDEDLLSEPDPPPAPSTFGSAQPYRDAYGGSISRIRPGIPAEARTDSASVSSAPSIPSQPLSMPSEARAVPSSRSTYDEPPPSPYLSSVPPPLPPPRQPAEPAPGFERQTSADGVPLLVPVQ